MEATKKIHRELTELVQSLDSTFAGQVFLPEEPLHHRDGQLTLQFALKPTDGIYKDCRMRFNVYLNAASYPHETPVVQMLDTVAHPNVDFFHSDCHYDESNICLSVLDDWNDEECHRDLISIVQGVLFLFYNPEPDDALVSVGDLDDLRELVECTKRGTSRPEGCAEFSHITFTNVYEGSELVSTESEKEGDEEAQTAEVYRQPEHNAAESANYITPNQYGEADHFTTISPEGDELRVKEEIIINSADQDVICKIHSMGPANNVELQARDTGFIAIKINEPLVNSISATDVNLSTRRLCR